MRSKKFGKLEKNKENLRRKEKGKEKIITQRDVDKALINASQETTDWLIKNIKKQHRTKALFMIVARHNNFDIIKRLYKERFPYDEYTTTSIIKNCSLEIVKWALEKKFPMCENPIGESYANPDKSVIPFLKEQGYEPTELTFTDAMEASNVEEMQWILDNNYPIDDEYIYETLNDNDVTFNVIKMLSDNKLIDDEFLEVIIRNYPYDYLKYICENSKPLEEIFMIIHSEGDMEKLKLLIKHGYKFSKIEVEILISREDYVFIFENVKVEKGTLWLY